MSLNPDTVVDTWTRLAGITQADIVDRVLPHWRELA